MSRDVPCNICALLKVREGKLEWTQIMRSNDLFRGFPHNVIQFSSLQEIMAGWLGLEVGSYHHYSDSLHLYENDGTVASHFEDIDPPSNTDNLSVTKKESDNAFKQLSRFCDFCADPKLAGSDILSMVLQLDIPEAHLNLARILAADSLRRRKSTQEMLNVLKSCTNESLIFMFRRWLNKEKQLPAGGGG